MIRFTMKIPIFEDGMPVNDRDDLHKIEFSHPQAVEMAIVNVQWQAEDTYFDALFEIWLDEALFFKQGTFMRLGYGGTW